MRGRHKILSGFKIQTDYLISAQWLDFMIIYKNLAYFAVPSDLNKKKTPENKNKNKKTSINLDLIRKVKKGMNHDGDGITICNWGTRNGPKKDLEEILDGLLIRGWIKTIQITALLQSARILRRGLETWEDMLSLTPVKSHHRTFWRKRRTRFSGIFRYKQIIQYRLVDQSKWYSTK